LLPSPKAPATTAVSEKVLATANAPAVSEKLPATANAAVSEKLPATAVSSQKVPTTVNPTSLDKKTK